MVNHANADCMMQFLQSLMRDFDVPAKDIKVLCYYRGQTRLMRSKIEAHTEWTDEVKASIETIEFSSVDAFQGKETDIVLLDIVSAKERQYVSKAWTTAYVKDPDSI